MAQTALLNDFSSGWCPQDDPINGRKNGLLNMDGIEMDQTGALVMSGGTVNANSTNYPADCHSLFSVFMSGVKKNYLALNNGAVYRDGTSIIIGGSTSRAGFCNAFNYNFIFSGSQRYRDDGTTVSTLGIGTASAPTSSLDGAGLLFGLYTYVQVNVANFNGAYIAQSVISLGSTPLQASFNQILVTPEAPSVNGGAFANEAWIFRIGGNLGEYFRIARLTATTGYGAFDDNISDLAAISLGIEVNQFLAKTDTSGIPDDILCTVGLINGRMVYFTASQIYFSVINDPDLYDTRQSIGFAANQNTGSEFFLWAKKLNENTIVIGTTADLYLLTGTYITQADGTLDIYLNAMGVDNPPIERAVAQWSSYIIYMAADGWRTINAYGQATSLCPPFTDRLYRGETLQGYGGVPIFVYPAKDSANVAVRYDCAVGRNKLWCRVPTIVNNNPALPFVYRIEVYDFIRKYWRVLPSLSPELLTSCPDDVILGFFSNGSTRNLTEIDNQFVTTIASANQNIHIKTGFINLGTFRQRKDIYALKFIIDTGNSPLTYNLYTNDDSVDIVQTGTLTANGYTEIDIPFDVVIKNFQIELIGQLANFQLAGIVVEYENRPSQLLYYNLLRQSFEGADNVKKRVRVWPIRIDTQGGTVLFTPSVDGVAFPSLAISTSGKQTVLYEFTSDAFGIDYSVIFQAQGATPFEIWEIGTPDVVQNLPIGKYFDQCGPIEYFGTGIIRQLELRVLPEGSAIDYNLYIADVSVQTGTISVVPNVEDSYYIPVKRIAGSNSGRNFRIELGPTNFYFYRYYVKAQVARSGDDRNTENEWINLDAEKNPNA